MSIAFLSGCSGGPPTPRQGLAAPVEHRQPPERLSRTLPAGPDASEDRAVPKGGGTYKIGTPYQIGGRWYAPREDSQYDKRGTGSWYGRDFHAKKTANGERFDMFALTAAHPTLPIPSYVYVTNEDNSRTVLLRLNDRGPYIGDRMIDLSWAAARALGYDARGLGNVRVRYAGRAPLDGDDSAERRYLTSQSWAADLLRSDLRHLALSRTMTADAPMPMVRRRPESAAQ